MRMIRAQKIGTWLLRLIAIAVVVAGTGCKKKPVDPFPASGAVAGWEKTSETRVFAAKDLWQYIDGDAEQYISGRRGLHLDLRLQVPGPVGGDGGRLHHERCGGRAQDSGDRQTSDAKTLQLGDAGMAYAQSVTFRKGPYLVRIVAYESTPETQQALLALAHGVEAKL